MNEKTEEFEMTVVEARNSVIDSGVIMDPQDLMRQAANRFETIDLNIIESEDIHVGPVISIADNVQNIEVAKGKLHAYSVFFVLTLSYASGGGSYFRVKALGDPFQRLARINSQKC